MTFKTHLALGMLGGLALGEVTDMSSSTLIQAMPFILLGSVAPDIDEPRSFIGRKIPIISHMSALLFAHRGLTHFIFIPLLLFAFGMILPQYSLILYSLGFGILCHHFGDLLTPSGIGSYFFPFSFGGLKHTARILPKSLAVKTGSMLEMAVVLPSVLALDGFLGYKYLGGEASISDMMKLVDSVLKM